MSTPTRSPHQPFARVTTGRAWTLLSTLTGILVIGHVFGPESPWIPQCPIFRFTGLYCPGCGATRALFLLAHGHPLLAAAMNPLLALASIFAVVVLLKLFPKSDQFSVWNSQTVTYTAILIVILFTVARNLPWEPFRLLAPGAMLGH